MKKLLIICLLLIFGSSLYSQQTRQPVGKWFISAGGGAMVYVGENDALAPFADRVTPSIDLSVGKWVDPMVALRLQFNGFNVKGASGSTAPFADLLSPQFSNGVYVESFDVIYTHLDVMLNFSVLVNGVNNKRVFELIPLVGVGWLHSSKKGVDFTSDNAAFTAGIAGKLKIAGNLSCQLELKGNLVNENTDGVMGNRNGEGIASATFGLTYSF